MSVTNSLPQPVSKPAPFQASSLVSRWILFYVVVLILAWLPFQNIAAALLVTAGLPPKIGNLLIWAKEIALLAVLGIAVISGGVRPWRKSEIFIWSFVALLVLYLPVGGLGIMARVAGIRMLLWPFLLYLIGRSIPMPRNGLRLAWGVLAAVFLIVAFIGFLETQFFSAAQLAQLQTAHYLAKGQDITLTLQGLEGLFYSAIGSRYDPSNLTWFRRMISTYLEPLPLGHALILPTVFLFYAFAGPRPALLRPRWMVGLGLVTLLLALILAASRGAILAALIGIGVVVLSSRRARLRSMVLVGAILLVAMSFGPVRTFVLNTINLEDPSSGGHIRQLQLGIQVVLQQPFGLGLGHGGYVGHLFTDGASEGSGESFFFSMSSQVGIIGVALFLTGFAVILLGLWRTWRRADTAWLKASAIVTLGSLLGYGVSAIASEAAFGLLSSGAVWFMSGVVIQLGNRRKIADHGHADVSPPQ